MLKMYIPEYKDMRFREALLADPETMAYNNAYGGTIPFPEEKWSDWYDRWIINTENKRYYRYLANEEDNKFVGEIAYHYDETQDIYLANIIVHAKYRGKGFGKQGLQLLCEAAKNNGIKTLYDDIANDNPSVKMFLDCGFHAEYRTSEFIMVKRDL